MPRKVNVIRTVTALIVSLIALTNLGCRGGAVVPDGWATTPLDTSQAWRSEAQVQRDESPRLQVMIHYNKSHSTHVALRITTHQHPAVFWDPGGAYGLNKPEYGRGNDIILDAPPDLPTWWTYRQRWIGEPLMLVFEWDLPQPHAAMMRDALLSGAKLGRDDPAFRTLRQPGWCNFAACEFLRTYGPPRIANDLSGGIFPDGLAKQLWQQTPSRVLRYEGPADAPPRVILPMEP